MKHRRRTHLRNLFVTLAFGLVLTAAEVLGGVSSVEAIPPDDVASAPSVIGSSTQCVPSVQSQFDALKNRAEPQGFFHGSSPEPSLLRHYQGIQRVPRAGTPVFYVSRNNNPIYVDDLLPPGYGSIAIVEFGLESSVGERIRSNRLALGYTTAETRPPLIDRGTGYMSFDGFRFPSYSHVGGMQLVDGVLAVALEYPMSPSFPNAMVALVDVADPLHPTMLQEIPLLSDGAGAVALAHHPDRDTYLMIVAKDVLDVYESDSGTLNASSVWTHRDRWVGSELIGGDWPTGFAAHQSINLIEQCDGVLFLLGTRNTLPTGFGGNDLAVLYRVGFTASGDLMLREVSSKHMVCNAEAGRTCDFAAAAAPYVSPSGELILYATEHFNNGPRSPDGSVESVRMGEFRHMDTYSPGSPLRLPTATAGGPYGIAEGTEVDLQGQAIEPQAKPWIELFADPNFGGYSFIVDWDDRYKEDLNDLDEIEYDLTSWGGGFGDEVSSVRWEAPPGCAFQLYEDQDYGGDVLGFGGSGSVDQWEDLRIGAFDDEAHSVGFSGVCNTTFTDQEWDLDDDGVYETKGAIARYNATNIDGPASAVIHFRARDNWGRYVTDTALVTIHNAAPSVEFAPYSTQIHEGNTGLFELRMWDPGKDPVSVTIDWGDGTQDSYWGSYPYLIVTARHEYADDDPSGTPTDATTIRIFATDDDHATSESTHTITVLNANPVVTIDSLRDPDGDEVDIGIHPTVHGELLALDATYRDPGESDTHTASVDWGDGTIDQLGTEAGSINANHRYEQLGRFTISVSVTDDDTGNGNATRTVDVVNSAPTALDDLARVRTGESVIIDCLSNDTDIDGDSLENPTIQTEPSYGRAAVLPDGSIEYTHDGTETVTDTLAYTTSDGAARSNEATISINITSGEANMAPIAAADTATIRLADTVLIDVLKNDSDPDGDTLAVVLEQPPAHGSVTLEPDGVIRYVYDGTPATSDSFTYRATDGDLTSAEATVTIAILGRFTDDDGSVFEFDIEWMAREGVTLGCNPPINDLFCPEKAVTRGQMSAFLVRALGLTDDGGGSSFVDDNGSVFEADIAKLAAAGITRGCNPPTNDRFCPEARVTRGQMAAFLVRALGYSDDGGGNLFTDGGDSIFESDIDKLATAGVTRGCNPPENDRFCPTSNVTRGQMAAFLRRALG